MYVRILNLLFQQKENLIFYADKYFQNFFFPYRQFISLKFHCSEERGRGMRERLKEHWKSRLE